MRRETCPTKTQIICVRVSLALQIALILISPVIMYVARSNTTKMKQNEWRGIRCRVCKQQESGEQQHMNEKKCIHTQTFIIINV